MPLGESTAAGNLGVMTTMGNFFAIVFKLIDFLLFF